MCTTASPTLLRIKYIEVKIIWNSCINLSLYMYIYCTRGYFRWGKISRKCKTDITRGCNFHITYKYKEDFAINAHSRKLPHTKISTFTEVDKYLIRGNSSYSEFWIKILTSYLFWYMYRTMNQSFNLMHLNYITCAFCTYFFVLICTVHLSKVGQGQYDKNKLFSK